MDRKLRLFGTELVLDSWSDDVVFHLGDWKVTVGAWKAFTFVDAQSIEIAAKLMKFMVMMWLFLPKMFSQEKSWRRDKLL